MDIFSIAPGLIDLGNEQHVGVYGLHLRNSPLPEGDRHKFGHVATESVDAACCPKEEDVEHLLPCVAIAIVQFGRIRPVAVADVPRVVVPVGKGVEGAGVVTGHVIGHKVNYDAHARPVGAADKQLKLSQAPGYVGCQFGGHAVVVAHGVGRACLSFHVGVGRKAVGREVCAGGMVEDACVPDVCGAQLADGLQASGGKVAQLAAAVLGKRAAYAGGVRRRVVQARKKLINDGLHTFFLISAAKIRFF